MTTGERIAQKRREKQWTQQDLADRMDLNIRSIRDWESGASMPASKTIINYVLSWMPPQIISCVCRIGILSSLTTSPKPIKSSYEPSYKQPKTFATLLPNRVRLDVVFY